MITKSHLYLFDLFIVRKAMIATAPKAAEARINAAARFRLLFDEEGVDVLCGSSFSSLVLDISPVAHSPPIPSPPTEIRSSYDRTINRVGTPLSSPEEVQ